MVVIEGVLSVEEIGVADQSDVGAELVLGGRKEGGEVLAARFFFALEAELDVDRQRAGDGA